MHPQRAKSGQPLGSVGLKSEHVKPLGHVPPHVPRNVTTPHGSSGPVQPQTPLASGTQALAFAHRPRQVPPEPKQSGIPRVVVVRIGHGPVVLVIVTVVDVEAAQQKFTSAGASWTSFGLQASRTLTPPLRVPSRPGFAHRTAASAAAERVITSITVTPMRMVSSPVRKQMRSRRGVVNAARTGRG